MWTDEYSATTSAAPEQVWAVLADVGAWIEWNAGIAALELDGEPAVGTTFRMTPPGEQPLASTIVEFDAGRRLTDVTEVDGIAVRVDHDVAAAGTGSSITYRVTVTGPAPDEVLAQIGAGASADFPEVLAALAARAESR